MTNSLIEFSQTISRLNKEKKYRDALNYFKDNKAAFTDQQIAGNEYIVSAMLTAMRHTSNVDPAFTFIERYKITISGATKEIVLNAYGWLLYFKFKAGNL